jgi:hypothetical protein
MQLVARTLRYLANQYLANPHRSYQDTALANAAAASARLRKRRDEQAEVDAYLRAWRTSHRGADETGPSQGGGDVERAR